jgi:small subunit ribosomal protein S1
MEESQTPVGPGEEELNKVEEMPEQESMESLLEQEGLGIDFPKAGETRTGTIASISSSEILVSVGAKSEGVISGREFDQISDEDRKELQVGSEIPVYILSPEDKNGNLVLSYTRAREERDWDRSEELLKSNDTFDSTIAGYNKGGLIVTIGQLRGFVPASQVSLVRRMNATGDTPDQRWSKMVGEPITAQVIEVDRNRRRLILSERQAINETRESLKDRLLDDLNVGDVRAGRVTSLADFGAFVNIEGADGLVHLSEVSWERVQHPSEVLKVGQEVQVQVISIDHDQKRIGLSIRRLQEDPWIKKVDNLREGQLVEGAVTHLTKFGAFARLGEDDLEGLIHISELSENRIEHPKEVTSEGDVLTLRIIKIDRERHRIGLSLRKVDSAAYADLDWKLLQEEIAEPTDEAEAEAVEEEVAAEEAEAVEEVVVAQEAAAEETEAEAVEEEVAAEEAEAVEEVVVAEEAAAEETEAEAVEEEVAAEEAEAVEEVVVAEEAAAEETEAVEEEEVAEDSIDADDAVIEEPVAEEETVEN